MDQNQLVPAGASAEREEFYGNFIFTFQFIFLLGVAGFIIWMGIDMHRQPHKGWTPLVLLVPLFAFSIVLGGQLFYFRLTEDNLEIRNHVFRWFRRKYQVKDIEILIFEQVGSVPAFALRVKSTGSRPWSFFAASLSYEDWYDFEKALRKRGIPLDNKLW